MRRLEERSPLTFPACPRRSAASTSREDAMRLCRRTSIRSSSTPMMPSYCFMEGLSCSEERPSRHTLHPGSTRRGARIVGGAVILTWRLPIEPFSSNSTRSTWRKPRFSSSSGAYAVPEFGGCLEEDRRIRGTPGRSYRRPGGRGQTGVGGMRAPRRGRGLRRALRRCMRLLPTRSTRPSACHFRAGRPGRH